MDRNLLLELSDRIAHKATLFENNSDLDEFLKDAVTLAREYTGSTVTAVFLYEHLSGKLVFKAGSSRDGILEPKSVSFGLDENIAGQAFREGRVRSESQREQTEHHSYGSRLAIPIHHGPENIGVLVFAHPNPDYFGREDEGALRTVAAQFGSILESASPLLKSEGNDTGLPASIFGQTASGGAVVGSALQFEAGFESLSSSSAKNKTAGGEDELKRFDASLERTVQQLEELQSDDKSPLHDMASLIFSSYVLMLNDDSFTGKMRQQIVDGEEAEPSIRTVVNEYTKIFSRMKETRLAEKAQDVRDLGYRLVRNLDCCEDEDADYRGQIAIARHIYPSDLIRLAAQNVAGIVLMGAGVTAHIAILARTLDLPVMITHDRSIMSIAPGSLLILDATRARLFTSPNEELLSTYRARVERSRSPDVMDSYILNGHTKDNISVSVSGNINLYSDAKEAARQGAEGIGLYRSEFPFIIKNDFLTEEQQYEIYRRIIMTMPGKPVILRTADIGGDKLMEGRGEVETNPFLGVRGIRFSLANKELFREQLRAMLRAGVDADLGIMLPMVSSVEEVGEAKQELHLCINQLKEEGVAHNDHPRIGAMVELPSAAISVADLAEETDFLSIGTNDLIMYLLAVDRTNEKLSHLYQSYHPAVLRTLSHIATSAGPMLKELSVCGDCASDPLIIPFLTGIGIRKLSVSPHMVENVKRYLAEFSMADTEAIAAEMLQIRKIEDMNQYLLDFRERYPVYILDSGENAQ